MKNMTCNGIRLTLFALATSVAFAAPVDVAKYPQPIRVACVGDSITQGSGAEKGKSYPSQLQEMLGAKWSVKNFGVSGRTLLKKGDHPYWNEKAYKQALEFAPDVVVIMLGTNDTKPANWGHHDEFYGDYKELVESFKLLTSKPLVYVCRPCPVPGAGNYGINEANLLVEIPWIDKLAKEENLGVIDMHAALAAKPQLLPDRVHPNTEGAGVMAGTVYHDLTGRTPPPATPQAESMDPKSNTAIIPVPKLEQDSYDWFKRHAEVVELGKGADFDIVLIGDSITHFWAGEPRAKKQNGPNAWRQTFGNHQVLNMGFGWDRTQNVLWRLEHGEMDGLHPKAIVINIGTNNFSKTANARDNTPQEISDGIQLICDRLHAKSPASRIVVMGVFPRGAKPDDSRRAPIKALNGLLAHALASRPGVTFLDIGAKMLEPDESISKDMLFDGTHPGEKGYAIWGRALIDAGVIPRS